MVERECVLWKPPGLMTATDYFSGEVFRGNRIELSVPPKDVRVVFIGK